LKLVFKTSVQNWCLNWCLKLEFDAELLAKTGVRLGKMHGTSPAVIAQAVVV
jgi:hypothetical protein